jgi:twitching motility two-component system response regulator PilG
MLSGKDGFFDKVKGKLAGSSDYITKPFDEQQLLKTVAGYMKKARPREGNAGRAGVEVG